MKSRHSLFGSLKWISGLTRFRLMLTLIPAVVLPAAAPIYVNFSQLRAFERDKVLEAAIHVALVNRGVLIAPFHNMMLISPATTHSPGRGSLAAIRCT